MCNKIEGSIKQRSNYCYTILNKVNNKKYIGVHTCRYDKCSYLGSGKVIKQAVKKHGKDNFEVTERIYFNVADNAYTYEGLVVTQETVDDPMYYNISPGGHGGVGNMLKNYQVWNKGLKGVQKAWNKGLTKENSEVMLFISEQNIGKVMSEETKQKISKSKIGKVSKKKGKPGPKASEETKQKMSASRKGKSLPTKGKPWSEARRKAHKPKINN